MAGTVRMSRMRRRSITIRPAASSAGSSSRLFTENAAPASTPIATILPTEGLRRYANATATRRPSRTPHPARRSSAARWSTAPSRSPRRAPRRAARRHASSSRGPRSTPRWRGPRPRARRWCGGNRWCDPVRRSPSHAIGRKSGPWLENTSRKGRPPGTHREHRLRELAVVEAQLLERQERGDPQQQRADPDEDDVEGAGAYAAAVQCGLTHSPLPCPKSSVCS